ncbi:hypothetical protein [Burkholderia anthina]|uniref:hypothetical protein n=1 Tax=Burkholderia anthina TaxID=179879 RepID=UPI00158CE9C3|nr:hypothetical protein [Burkholderia anthina]
MRERRDIRRDAQLSRFLVAHVLSQSGMSARWGAHVPDYPARMSLLFPLVSTCIASHRVESRAGTGCDRFSRRQYVISKTEKTRDARRRIVRKNAIRSLNEIEKFRFGGIRESRGSQPGFSR